MKKSHEKKKEKESLSNTVNNTRVSEPTKIAQILLIQMSAKMTKQITFERLRPRRRSHAGGPF